jgi:hypothetical protein
MNTRHRQAIYLVLSALGAILTWKNNLEWAAGLEVTGPAALAQFWRDAFATPVSASLAWDILIAGTAAFVLVLVESRRLGMRWWPLLYLVLGNLIAAAFAFPLFLFFRERRLSQGE